MADQQQPDNNLPNPAELSAALADITERSQKLISDFMARQAAETAEGQPDAALPDSPDPLNVTNAFMDLTAKLLADPSKLMQAQMAWWQDSLELWQRTAQGLMAPESTGSDAPVIEPAKGDRRFRDDAWQENELFNYIKQSYLLTARLVHDMTHDVDGLDEKAAQKVDFYTRQFVDALSPTNFLATNPAVLRETAESGGENLLRGLNNLLNDLERGKGQLKISMTDMDAFTVGENVATTPGKVVYRNDLIELIQYEPTTKNQRKRPLLVIPPWINKYYILDLRPENSFLKWATDQGNTVFVISWINPGAQLRDKDFEHYMLEGPLAAIDAIEQATGVKGVNLVGYCIGGTLLAGTLAYMAATGDKRAKSATFFTTLVDFEDAGELSVFVDEEQINTLIERIAKRGYQDGAEMAASFSLLRSNDLIWSFVVNNYLMGKDPFPFDLLYWNADSTCMPYAMHAFYLRNMYLNNTFKDPNGVQLNGVPIDLRKIEVPTYILATKDDHIAPWKSTYAAANLYSGPVRYVLAASGHIAGVINPPAANKYCHWRMDGTAKNPKSPDDWFAKAEQHDGSWWDDWDKWLKKYKGGKDIPARTPGDGKLKPLGKAPGTYVLMNGGGA